MKLVSGELMSNIDKYTIKDIGIPGTVLMENAGKGVYEKFIEKFQPEKESDILIVCGKGNNGGDGFVIGRWLFNKKFKNIKIALLTKGENLKGDAKVNYEICRKIGMRIFEIEKFEEFKFFVKIKITILFLMQCLEPV